MFAVDAGLLLLQRHHPGATERTPREKLVVPLWADRATRGLAQLGVNPRSV